MVTTLKRQHKVEDGSQALTRGLEVLRVLAEAHGPMTSTEIAERVGLHQSWTSRILKTLIASGYVRKPSYHQFAVNYGILALGTAAYRQFAFAMKPRTALVELSERAGGMLASLGMLERGQLIWFLRTQKNQDTIPVSAGGYPLHLSTIALRLLADMEETEALRLLELSRRSYGWERPTERVPSSPAGVLQLVHRNLQHDCLVLEDYIRAELLVGAIPIHVPGEPPVALALSGPGKDMRHESAGRDAGPTELRLLLVEGRRAVETAMA
jgi:IclR family acetate operon transcriptional repressor